MTNEELAVKIQSGEIDLMLTLWEQVQRYACRRAGAFYYTHYDRCAEMGVERDDLEQEAYLAIHKAVEKYSAEKGFKFLTYAAYQLKAYFYVAAKLTNGSFRYKEVKYEDIETASGDGECRDWWALKDPCAESELAEVIEQEYLLKLTGILGKALGILSANQKEAVIACSGYGMTAAEYARRKGVSRQSAHGTKETALRKLRADRELAAYAG